MKKDVFVLVGAGQPHYSIGRNKNKWYYITSQVLQCQSALKIETSLDAL